MLTLCVVIIVVLLLLVVHSTMVYKAYTTYYPGMTVEDDVGKWIVWHVEDDEYTLVPKNDYVRIFKQAYDEIEHNSIKTTNIKDFKPCQTSRNL